MQSKVFIASLLTLVVAVSALDESMLWNPKGFIRVQGRTFVDDECKEFLPNGWNTWNQPMLDIAVAAANGDSGSINQLEQAFSMAARSGFNVMRMFLQPVSRDKAMQNSPGSYNEDRWKGVDYLLSLGRKYYVKLILVFVNNWQQWEGPQWYVDPAAGDLNAVWQDQFWWDRTARERLYNYMLWVVNRVNTITGVAYKDDPTIFAWNLYNELRCPANQAQDEAALSRCLGAVQQWADETSAYLKLIDPNHLIGFGQEGFFGRSSDLQSYNPSGVPGNVQAGWSAWVGQDFESQHSPANIDFLSFHMWMDNWQTFDISWIDGWINAHVIAAERLHKPVILQEFGKRSDKARAADIKDPVYLKVYEWVSRAINSNTLLKGSLFWYWDPLGYVNNMATSDMSNGNFPPSGSVVHSDGSDPTTWKYVQGIITDHGDWQYRMQQRVVQECTRVGGGPDSLTIAG